MASSKWTYSNESSEIKVAPGKTQYYNFAIPKASKKPYKVELTLPMECTNSSSTFTLGGALSKTSGTYLKITYRIDGGEWISVTEGGGYVPYKSQNYTFALTVSNVFSKVEVCIDSESNSSFTYGSFTNGTATIKRPWIYQYVDIDGSIEMTAPADNSTSAASSGVTVNWKMATPGEVTSLSVWWKKDGVWKEQKMASLSATSYTIPAASLPEGNYLLDVEVKDSWDNKYETTPYRNIIRTQALYTSDMKPNETSNNYAPSDKITFTWKQNSDFAITSQSIVINGTSYSLSASATSYVLPAYSLNVGTYSWYLNLTDNTGKTYKSDSQKFTVALANAGVTLSSPTNYASVSATGYITFKWNRIVAGSSITSNVLYYKRTTDSSYKSVTLNASDVSYSLNPRTLNVGTYMWYVSVVDSFNNRYTSAVAYYEVTSKIEISNVSPTSGTYKRNEVRTFKWQFTCPGTVASQKLYYKKNTDANYTVVSVSTSVSEYSFKANYFSAGYYYWYIECTDSFGNVATSSVYNITLGIVPTVSLTYPSGSFWRSLAQTFEWNFSSQGLTQTKFQIQYKKTSEASWNSIIQNSASNTYTFSAGFFDCAIYNIKLTVWNEDGLSATASVSLQAGAKPTISIKSPADNAKLRNATSNVFEWTISDAFNSGQKSYEIQYRKTTSTTWTSISYTSTTSKHTFAAKYFDAGTYAWRLRAQNNDGTWSDYSVERTFTYGSQSTLSYVSPDANSNVRSKADLTISWTSTDTFNVGQKSFEIGYTITGQNSWTTKTGTTAESYTFPSGTFGNNKYTFRLRITNNDDLTTSYLYLDIQIGSIPSVAVTYPVECVIKADMKQFMTWTMTETIETGQKSFVLGYKKKTDTTWTEQSGTTSNQYYELVANTFTAGTWQFRVKVVNNDDASTDFVYSEFTVIGQTEAPVLTNVTMSAIPTITWTVESQDTFEFELYKDNERIYASGVRKGYNIRSYTPNIMIPDGNYMIRMRCMNEYGYFTEWMAYSFILASEKPSALNCYIYANEYHGVNVVRSLELDDVAPVPSTSDSPTPNAIYVIRKLSGSTDDWQIIGKLSTVYETSTFIDNTAEKDVEYEYALRNYKEEAGYTDSQAKLIELHHKGVIIYHGNEYVNLTLSEKQQFDITHTPAKVYSYAQMIGRTYPVKESSEWMTHTTSFSSFVNFEEYNELNKMMASNDDLWIKGKNFSFACSIDSLKIKAAQLDTGYDIDITVSRVGEDELRLF